MRKQILFKAALAWALITGLFILSFQNVVAADFEKFNMSYLYFGNSSSYEGLVDSARDSLDAVAPSYFDLNDDGSLKLTSAINKSFISSMHDKGMQVTPFLSNHWDREKGVKALSNREALAAQIAASIVEYGLDGVDIDIENLTPAEKDSYVDFLRLLRQKLPQDSSISIAVAPNPWNLSTGWNASYDYAALAQYADYLMLMAYDEHYQGGPEGPVASATFVEGTIRSALEKVPSEKLVLGVAFYGRLWMQGKSYGGYGVSNSTVEELISKYKGKVVWDSSAKSPKAVITIKAADVKPVIFGKKLDAGTYEIWYENEESIKYKLQLVQKYNLKGTGSWSLGQESHSTWDYFTLWLEGMYFKDVQGNWAQRSIINVINNGWMLGVPGSQFQPEGELTRAQAAVILVRALGLESSSGASATSYFSDTAKHWASNEIDIAREHNIVAGTGNGRFSPDLPVTREQMAVMLDRVLKGTTGEVSGNVGFADVNRNTSSWSYDSIMKMAENGIIKGYADGLFHPADNVSRAQMAVLMDRSIS